MPALLSHETAAETAESAVGGTSKEEAPAEFAVVLLPTGLAEMSAPEEAPAEFAVLVLPTGPANMSASEEAPLDFSVLVLPTRPAEMSASEAALLILCTRNIPPKGFPSKCEGDRGGGGLFTGSASGNDNANRLSSVCKTAGGKGGGPGGGGGKGSNGGVDVTHGVEDASTLLPLVTKFFLEKPRLT